MSAGHIYVIAFTDGTVKVGRTQNAAQRLNAHKSAGRKFGLTVTGEWLSPLHAEWRESEEALKKIAADLGGTAHSKEYFSGVDFAAVVAEAERLPFTPPMPSIPCTPEPVALVHPGGGEDAPSYSLEFDVAAERRRRAEAEAQQEEVVCYLLRLYRKAQWGPDTIRGWAHDGKTPGEKKVFTGLAELMEAQMTYEAVMNEFVSLAHPA